MGGAVSICTNFMKDKSEIQVIGSNQKGNKKLKRIKTKFPKKNVINDEDDDEEVEQNKKDENKNKNDKNIDKDEKVDVNN